METIVLGIDLGTQKCVVGVGSDTHGIRIATNELGNFATPTLVAFKGRARFLGERALSQMAPNAKNTITELVGLLSARRDEWKGDTPFPVVASHHDAQHVAVEVEYEFPGASTASSVFVPEQLLGMLFKSFRSSAEAFTEAAVVRTVLTVPSHFDDAHRRAVLDAAAIGGLPWPVLVSTSGAMAAGYLLRHNVVAGAQAEMILFVDVGHTSTEASLFWVDEKGATLVSCLCAPDLGARVFTDRLYDHVVKELRDKRKIDVKEGTRTARRLRNTCERNMQALSVNPLMHLSMELEDRDIVIDLTREIFEDLCKEERGTVAQLIFSLLEKAKVETTALKAVELVGGGARIPFVQAAIASIVGEEKVRRTLDSASVCGFGAAALGAWMGSGAPVHVEGAAFNPIPEEVVGMGKERLDAAVAQEAAMQAQDTELARTAEARNRLESYIYETRDMCHGDQGALLCPNRTLPLLQQEEDWLFGEGEDASMDVLTARLEALSNEVHSIGSAYFDHMEQQGKARKQQEEDDAKRWAVEREQEGGDHEDHDFRKLKKEDRMRLVTRNKEEANELFKDGNVEMAAKRYVKALNHCEKFFDLSPDDKKAIDQIRVSLLLNLALCFLKMGQWKRVIDNCDQAMKMDPNSAKALFRRAQAHEKLEEWDRAERDLKRVDELTPNDPAVAKARERIAEAKRKEKAKEKKVYAKMFS